MSNEERSTEGRKDTDLYFTHVISGAPNVALLLGHLYLEGHDPSITRVMLLRDGTFYFVYDLPDITYGTTLLPATDEQPFAFAMLGRRGLLRINPTGQAPHDETLTLPNAYVLHLQEIAGSYMRAARSNKYTIAAPTDGFGWMMVATRHWWTGSPLVSTRWMALGRTTYMPQARAVHFGIGMAGSGRR